MRSFSENVAFGVALDSNSSAGELSTKRQPCVAEDLHPEGTRKAKFLEKFETSLDDCVPPDAVKCDIFRIFRVFRAEEIGQL